MATKFFIGPPNAGIVSKDRAKSEWNFKFGGKIKKLYNKKRNGFFKSAHQKCYKTGNHFTNFRELSQITPGWHGFPYQFDPTGATPALPAPRSRGRHGHRQASEAMPVPDVPSHWGILLGVWCDAGGRDFSTLRALRTRAQMAAR